MKWRLERLSVRGAVWLGIGLVGLLEMAALMWLFGCAVEWVGRGR